MSKSVRSLVLVAALFAAPLAVLHAQQISIVIDPTSTRYIEGTTELDRPVYFNTFYNIDKPNVKTQERYDWLVKENRMEWGSIQGVMTTAYGGWNYPEDPNRPGFVDQAQLLTRLDSKRYVPTEEYRNDMGNRIELISHDSYDRHPSFMGQYNISPADHNLPANLDAVAELYALSLRDGFSDFNRPEWLELINEPHWAYWRDQHFANLHTRTRTAVKALTPQVQVGGPCLPVAYYYANQYDGLGSFSKFIDNTNCSLDFYSFHVYDFLNDSDVTPNDIGGRITSGLPLESVLDLIQNYTVNKFSKKVNIGISETGGYGANARVLAEARARIPGEGTFDWEMKRRSISDFNMVNSLFGNMLTYMDHPDTVKKACPFIMLETMAWNPQFYATLYVPNNYTDTNNWVATKMIHFYQMFRDLQGRRVAASCPDPDVQTRAFVDGNATFVVMNNLSNFPKSVGLNIPTPTTMKIRRHGRNADLTPYFTEVEQAPVTSLALQPREAVLIRAEYAAPIVQQRVLNEISRYGNKVISKLTSTTTTTSFTVNVPNLAQVDHAWLRVGISRPLEGSPLVNISLNGNPLVVPLEQSAERLTEAGGDYASCKLIRLTPAMLQATNTVTVSFPDGKNGAVGSVVIRAAYNVAPPTLAATNIVDDKGGNPIVAGTAVNYTVTFSEDINAATVSAADFGNAGTSTVTFGAISETSPGVFRVPVTPISAGTLRLRVNAGAVITDVEGIALTTTAAIPDDTTLTVTNAVPVWTGDPLNEVNATEDAVYNSTLADNASDGNGHPLTFTKVNGPAWLSVATNGALSGTPINSDVGANSFTVSVSDGFSPAVQATLNITVTNTNDAPVFTANPILGGDATEDIAYSGTLAGKATDVDAGATLTYAKVNGPSWLSVAASGVLSGTPSNSDLGENEFIVSVSDGIAPAVQAQLKISAKADHWGPYSADASTLHLWHLDAAAVPAADSVATDALPLAVLGGGATLANTGYTGFGTALSTIDAGAGSAIGAGTDAYLAPLPLVDSAADNVAWSFADPTTGAFTYEALVRLDFNPLTTQTRTISMMILSGDSEGSGGGTRSFQFRLDPKGASPSADGFTTPLAGPALHFISIRNAVSGQSEDKIVPLPTTGTHAVAQGVWFHVAVTYNGNEGLADNLKFYWTKVDPTFNGANPLGNKTLTRDLSTGQVDFAIGQLGRSPSQNNFVGAIDEVRISKVARSEYDFIYGPDTVNDAPVFGSNPITGANATEDTAYSGTLAGTATDLDASATQTYSKVTGPTWLSVAANGDLSGIPTDSDVGANSFTVSVSDGIAPAVQATLNIMVINTNDAPVFTTNPIAGANATEDAAYASTLAGKATDVDAGATLTYAKVNGPSWLSVAATGALSGTPSNSDVGANSFTVSVSDGIAPAVEATLNITVINTNDAPVFAASPIAGANAIEDAAYTGTLAGAATDVDADATLAYAKVSGPAWLSIATDGVVSGTPANSDVGANSFTVSVSDGIAPAVEATLNITVTSQPKITSLIPADNATGVAVGVNLVATFSEPIAIGTGAITIRNLTDGTQTVITLPNAQVTASGSVLTINPTADLPGGKDYAVWIGTSAIKGLAENFFGGITSDTTWSFSVLATSTWTYNGTDATNNTWTTAASWSGGIIAGGSNATANFILDITAARAITLGGDQTIGNITFTDTASSHNLSLSGNTLTFDVTTGAPVIDVTQSDRTLTIDSIIAGNDGLTKTGFGTLAVTGANNFTGATTVSQGTLNVLDNTNGLKSSSSLSIATGATVNVSGTSAIMAGNWTIAGTLNKTDSAPQWFWNPVALNNGTISGAADSATYGTYNWAGTTINANGSSNAITAFRLGLQGGNQVNTPLITDALSISSILGANDAAAKAGTLLKRGLGSLTLTGANIYTGTTAVTAGKIFINGNQSTASGNVTVSANATLGGTGVIGGNTTIAANGRLEFNLSTHAASYDKLELAAGKSLTFSGASTLTITTSGGAAPGSYTLVTAPGGISGSLPALVLPPDWSATLSIVGNNLVLNVSSTMPNTAPVANAQSVTTNEDSQIQITLSGSDAENNPLNYTVLSQPTEGTLSGTLPSPTYTPNANANGTDSFTFRVNDGSLDSAVATVSINVTAVNDAPVALAQSVNTAEDATRQIILEGTDEENSPLTYTVLSQPAKGTLSGTGSSPTYTPNANANGTDSFTFRVNDGSLDSAVATVSINVTAVNDAPVALAQSVTTAEDTTHQIILEGADVENSPLTYTVLTQPTEGTLSGTGSSPTYTPNANANGTDSFTFRVNDGSLDSAVATVSINVTAVNDAPVALAQSVTTAEDTTRQIILEGADEENSPLTYTVLSQPTKGTLSGTGSSPTYTPNENANGTDSFTFRVNDGSLDSAVATVSINVTAVNDAPTFTPNMVAGGNATEDSAYSDTLAGRATDVDAGATLTYRLVSNPGWLSVAANGALSGTPTSSNVGLNTFTVSVSDGIAPEVTATLNITVDFSGFRRTTTGPWDYNTADNWTNGTINGLWNPLLILSANQTVTFAADTSAGTGLTFNHGGNFPLLLLSSSTATRNLTLGGNISLNTGGGTTANVAIGSSSNPLNINLGGATRTTTVAANRTLTLANVVSNGGISKTGLGTLALSGNNNYTGITTVNNGTLTLGHSNALGAIAAGSGTVINGSSAVAFNGTVLNLGTTGITLSESLNLNGNTTGRATLHNNSAAGQVINGNIDVTSDTNHAQVRSDSAGSITVNGDISGSLTNGATLIIRGDSTSANTRILGSINIGNAALNKNGTGTWTIGATGKSYAWGDTLIPEGTLRMGVAAVMPSATVVTFGQSGSTVATLDLNGKSQTVAGIQLAAGSSGAKTITSATAATLNVGSASDFTYGGVLTGSLDLTKSGAGVLTLTATSNTYTGPTIVSAGTLLINGSTSASSAVTVNGGNLGGTGTIGGNVTVAAAGNLAPGVTAGTLNITGNLDLSAMAAGAGTLKFGLNALADSNDRIAVGGSLVLGTIALDDLAVTNLGGLQAGTYTLITSTALTGTVSGSTALIATGFNGKLQRNGNNLELVVTVAPLAIGLPPVGYAAWTAGGGVFDADDNGDGVANGIAWLLGAANPSENALNILPAATHNGTYLRLSFRCLKSTRRSGTSLKIQSSSDCGATDPWTSNEAEVPDEDTTVNGVVFETRDDGDYIHVIADIPTGGDKLFGRLSAVTAP